MKQTRIEELESMVRPDLSSNRDIQCNQKVNPFAFGFIMTLVFLAFLLSMTLTIMTLDEISKEKVNMVCKDGLEYRVDSESNSINMVIDHNGLPVECNVGEL